MDKKKPYKGKIYNWWIDRFNLEDFKTRYPGEGGLGYIIWGTRDRSPLRLGNIFHTSYVIRHNRKTGEIETRNSRYKLVGPEIE